jgi:RNA polymerase sigma-70 factor (ECF subfamily)
LLPHKTQCPAIFRTVTSESRKIPTPVSMPVDDSLAIVPPEQALAAALDAHRPVLQAWFTRRLGNRHDAEDHVQEVYARALATVPAKNIASPRGFLLRIASTVLVDRYRRDKVRERHNHVALAEAPEVEDGAGSPERALAARQQLALVEAALLELDPLPRQIFMLARLEGLSHREIGGRLGLEPVQVSRQVERAMAHLARRLARAAS